MADIIRNDDARQYQLTVDGEIASILDFRDDGRSVALIHTGTEEKFSGHGYGTQIATYALRDVLAQGKNVIPLCPLVAHVIATDDEFAELR